jgi:hypothetical protein
VLRSYRKTGVAPTILPIEHEHNGGSVNKLISLIKWITIILAAIGIAYTVTNN